MTALLQNQTFAIAAFIFGFGFLVFVHEMGHFLVAKWAGIRATQFAVGFGNALVSYRSGLGLRFGGTEKEYWEKAATALADEGVSLEGLSDHVKNQKVMEKADAMGMGETEYRLNFLPLGGYVKMLGQEDLDPNAQSDDPRSYNRKSVGARMAVISAGVVMNLIFGLLFFIFAFQMGVRFPASVVGDIMPLKPAAQTYATGHEGEPAYRGLRPGDKITHVNGKPAQDITKVKIATALGKSGTPVKLTIERVGEPSPLVYAITAKADSRQEGMLSTGIFPASTLDVDTVFKNTLYAEAGVTSKMKLVAVNDLPVADYGAYVAALNAAGGASVVATFRDAESNQKINIEITPIPAFHTAGDDQVDLLGLMPATEITEVSDDSPAAALGIQEGDLLARVGNTAWPAIEDVFAAAASAGRTPLAVQVFRDGITIDLGEAQTENGRLGIELVRHLSTARIGRVAKRSPLDAANLPLGSLITSVNGTPIANWSELQQILTATPVNADAAILQIAVNLADNPTETLALPLGDTARSALAHAGWNPPQQKIGFAPLQIELKASNPLEATQLGLEKSRQFIQQTYITLLRLFQGSVGVKNLRGPVGIVDQGAKIARGGWSYYLFFLALISINLAVINFLPLPIVDGGHMVFLLYEKIAGRPASPAIQTAVALVGVVGLLSLFVYITFNDITRLITG
ncbi:MAG: site-2 protease family protein [Algisphaera sp.]